jgi:hypothetical protein
MKFNVFIRIINWKTKYTTLSKQLQKSNHKNCRHKRQIDTHITHIHMTGHYPGLVQSFQSKVAGLN